MALVGYRELAMGKVFKHLISALNIVLLILFSSPLASALSPDQQKVYNSGVNYFDTNPATSSGSSACSASLTGSVNAEKIWNYYTGNGLSPVATAALMGNFKDESGLDPNATNPSSGAFGIAQWLGGRLTALNSYASDAGSAPSDLGVQLNFSLRELTGSYKTTVTNIINAPGISPSEATLTVYNNYEGLVGSGQGSVDSRTSNAIGYLSLYGSGSGSTGTTDVGTSSCGGGSNASGACSANGIATTDEYTDQQFINIFGPPSRNNLSALVDMTFFGNKVTVNKVIAPCLKAVEQDITSNGISYRPESIKGGVGCYRERDGQVGDRSYHVFGAACDINPNTNNYFSNGIPRPYNPNCPIASGVVDSGNCYDMPQDVIAAFARHGFYWGGNFTSIKDYMHFEWHGAKP